MKWPFLFALLFSVAAHSATMNIQEGNVAVGSSIQLDQALGSDPAKVSRFSLGVSLQYFLIDRFAVGGAFYYNNQSGSSDTAIAGPAVTYIFWTGEKLSSYVSLGYGFGLTDATIKGRVTTVLGVEYFFTSSVAFGPYFAYRHDIGRLGPNQDRLLMGASFSIYL